MAIGVFDSGVGGLSIHRALVERFPAADFVYLADQANAPYGPRDGEEIVELTRAGCARLFTEGASLIVLACNTASAIALRRLQQTWLPSWRGAAERPVNVIGIIVPTIEAATGVPWSHEAPVRDAEKLEQVEVVGVFATTATAASRVYEIEIHKRRDDVAVFSEPCAGLAGMIEANASREDLKAVIFAHADALKRRVGRAPDRAILGCTHYELVADLFAEALPSTPMIVQPPAVADALERYLAAHPDYAAGGDGRRLFLTTGAAGAQNALVEAFWGEPLKFAPA